jgi:hypothetical protein
MGAEVPYGMSALHFAAALVFDLWSRRNVEVAWLCLERVGMDDKA